jgi:hypothetical protein
MDEPVSIITTLSSMVTTAWGWVGSAFSTASSHTEMYIPVAVGIVGVSIGLFKRAVRVGGRNRR